MKKPLKPTFDTFEEKKEVIGPSLIFKINDKKNRPIDIEKLALELNITVVELQQLINKLEKSKEINGIFTQEGRQYLSMDLEEMEAIAGLIEAKGRISCQEIA